MREKEKFGPRSLEELAKAFETNYEIYSNDLRETGLIEEPEKLFEPEKDEIERAALLKGAAAFFSLPESLDERMRLISEVRKLSQDLTLSEEAQHALWYYALHGDSIRQELGLDWRNAIIRALNEANIIKDTALAREQFKAGFSVKFAEMLDRVFLVMPLAGAEPSVRDVMGTVKKAPAFGIIKTDHALALQAYLEDFDTTKGKRKKY